MCHILRIHLVRSTFSTQTNKPTRIRPRNACNNDSDSRKNSRNIVKRIEKKKLRGTRAGRKSNERFLYVCPVRRRVVTDSRPNFNQPRGETCEIFSKLPDTFYRYGKRTCISPMISCTREIAFMRAQSNDAWFFFFSTSSKTRYFTRRRFHINYSSFKRESCKTR